MKGERMYEKNRSYRMMSFSPEQLHPELVFQTARSSGKGGQHVNKVETKVALRFDIPGSSLLPDHTKAILLERLTHRLTDDGVLILVEQGGRSQWSNKTAVIKKFNELIHKALLPVLKRKKTRPPASAKQKRRKDKEHRSEIKKARSGIF